MMRGRIGNPALATRARLYTGRRYQNAPRLFQVGAQGNSSAYPGTQQSHLVPRPSDPGCGLPPPTFPGMGDCPTEGIIYCFVRLGQRATNIAAGVSTRLTLTPVNVERFVPRMALVSIFDTGTSTPNLNAQVDTVIIKGDDQLAGGPVAVSVFNLQMTVLEVNWREVTPQNPLFVNVTHFNAANNADIQVVVAGDAIK